MPQIKLEETDGGAAENIIIEGGPQWVAQVDTGGVLHPLEQAVLLCLCTDVANSNPAVRGWMCISMLLFILMLIHIVESFLRSFLSCF
jgi:hypothetical protein